MPLKKCKCGQTEVNFKFLQSEDLDGFEDECCKNAQVQAGPASSSEASAPEKKEEPQKSRRGPKPKSKPVLE